MFLIPLVIILAIVGFSFVGDVAKDVGFSFGDFLTVPASTPAEEQRQTTQPQPISKQQTPPSVVRPPPEELAPQETVNSPFFEKITISNVRPTKDFEPALITLRTSYGVEQPISITGWKIKSNWLGEFTIPQGIERIQTSLGEGTQGPILVTRNDTVYLRGEESSLSKGKNFRPNSCFGYLKTFYPSIPGFYSCSQDRPNLEDISHLTPGCQDFIWNKINYGSCTVPDYSQDPAVATSRQCIDYIVNLPGGFNYNGCYQKRSQEQNFLRNEWHVYMNTRFGHPLHDLVTLYDSSGLIVDTYIY